MTRGYLMYLSYRVVSFGSYGGDSFWTSPRFFTNELDARLFFEETKYDPDVDGVYLVRVKTSSWSVLTEYNTGGTSIGMTPQGTIKVSRAPKLVFA